MAKTQHVNVPDGPNWMAVATNGVVWLSNNDIRGGLEVIIYGEPGVDEPTSLLNGHTLKWGQDFKGELTATEWLYIRATKDGASNLPLTADNPLNYIGAA